MAVTCIQTTSRTWLFATQEAFYCIGITYGTMIAFPSYADKRNRIYLSTLIITVTNVCTNLLAGKIFRFYVMVTKIM